jgi:hypothetical protein
LWSPRQPKTTFFTAPEQARMSKIERQDVFNGIESFFKTMIAEA